MPIYTRNGKKIFEEIADGVGYNLEIKTILHHSNLLQDVLLFESPSHGKVLALNDVIQLTEREEATYHEAISHVPLLTHPNPESILIIGGGDGGVASRVLMHQSVKFVQQVEIDPTVVSISKKYLVSVHNGSFDDARFTLLIEDGASFVKSTDRKFDVIIIDCSDPADEMDVNNSLFTLDFFTHLSKILRPFGLVVIQSGIPNQQPSELVNAFRGLQHICKFVYCYLVDAPMYSGGSLAISIGSNDIDALNVPLEIVKKRFDNSLIKTKYYNPDLHKAMFSLPNSVIQLIKQPHCKQ